MSGLDRWSRGDAAPRQLWVAVLLGVLMPGLGHLYCGRVRQGLTIWLVALTVVVVCLVVWARWLFVPVMPALVLFLAWVALQGVLAADLTRWIERFGATHRLGPINHPLAYVSVLLGLWVLPLGLATTLVSQLLVGSLEVRTTAMFPHLLPGDRVLYDRSAYADRPPAAGELVVVDHEQRGEMVARVVALGGHTVHVRGGRLVLDGEPVRYGPLGALRVPRFTGPDATRLAALEGYLERVAGRGHVVTFARDAGPRGSASPTRLGPDELYVIGDNRDAALEARWHGRVPRSAVLGRPRCIWASVDAGGFDRPGRMGLQVR